ncbi:hypothetical protein [Trueperella sp. LYQ143]|uniref:hypothetical protein n=1 Tax=unclassified Trueperella TaxID=2630174 RepID=UPI0039839822
MGFLSKIFSKDSSPTSTWSTTPSTTTNITPAVNTSSADEAPAQPSVDLNQFSPQEQAALLAGHKIEAIKLYRERTGASLAEAKRVIDSIG